MMKRLLPSLIGIGVACTVYASVQFFNTPAPRKTDPFEEDIRKLVMATVMINNYYVDSVSSKKQVEDAINGIKAAVNAGMLSVGIPSSFKGEELLAVGADKIAEKTCLLPELIANW